MPDDGVCFLAVAIRLRSGKHFIKPIFLDPKPSLLSQKVMRCTRTLAAIAREFVGD